MRKNKSKPSVFNIPRSNTIHGDNRLGLAFFYSRRNLRVLRSIGIIGENEGWRSYERRMFRLLTNPSSDLIDTIVRTKESLFRTPTVLGVQVRCAGLLSDDQESAVKLDEADLRRVPNQVKQVAYSTGVHRRQLTVFLSTDSDVAEERLRRSLKMYHIVSVRDYKRGHTTRHKVSDESIQRALLDLYLLAQSQTLLVTGTSGYGTVAYSLSDVRKFNFIPVTKRHLMNM